MTLTDKDLPLLAMALCPGMTGTGLEKWHDADLTPEEFLTADKREICRVLGITPAHQIAKCDRRGLREKAEREAEFVTRHSIKTYFATADDYPFRLTHLYNPPAVLFALGNGSIEMPKSIGSVGTRRPTPYGSRICHDLVASWCDTLPDLTVVSGLAYGIDAVSHTTALEHDSPTIAVVAHGLDRIYPAQHRQLACDIATHNGLIVSQYPSGTSPYRQRFLERNRIIAALSDATVVMESAYRGGALSTASVAFEMDREVFAVPGRIGDETSEGCNMLIRRNKAHILTDADYLPDVMNWKLPGQKAMEVQQSLFPELDESQMPVYQILKDSTEPLTADTIIARSRMTAQAVMAILSDLEFDGAVVRYQGNRFSIS